jgi:D-alanine-D-alanine ligase
MNTQAKILVITGGLSNEKELSIISGEDVTRALIAEGAHVSVLEVTVDKKMILYQDPSLFLNRKSISANSEEVKKFDCIDFSILKSYSFDVAFLALDGKFGEDGHIQALLDLVDIPYTGSGVMASSIGMDKSKTYELVASFGIDVPEYFIIYRNNFDLNEVISRIDERLGFPCVIKPNNSGSSIGVTSPSSKDEVNASLEEAFKHSPIVIIQKFVKGREFACGILGNTGYSELEILPVVESLIKDYAVFTHHKKYYADDTEEVCPAKIDRELTQRIMEAAKLVHSLLRCDGLSRSDFRYDDVKNILYFLEINTSPGHTENSICPQEARSLGMTFGEFILKQTDLAIQKVKKTYPHNW